MVEGPRGLHLGLKLLNKLALLFLLEESPHHDLFVGLGGGIVLDVLDKAGDRARNVVGLGDGQEVEAALLEVGGHHFQSFEFFGAA